MGSIDFQLKGEEWQMSAPNIPFNQHESFTNNQTSSPLALNSDLENITGKKGMSDRDCIHKSSQI